MINEYLIAQGYSETYKEVFQKNETKDVINSYCFKKAVIADV